MRPLSSVRAVPALADVKAAVSYQPASCYWAFEWAETAIFLVLALALAGSCFWWLSRRLS